MTLPPVYKRLSHVGGADGFTIVEVLIAALVLVTGILAMIGAFDSARKLNLLSERRTVMAHRAQLEIERLQTYPYSQLAMITAPSHSSETGNPDYYVNYNSPVKCKSAGDGCFAWNAEGTSEEETLVPVGKNGECTGVVTTECGVVSSTPTGRKCSESVGACEWSDALVEGKVYDFVTFHADKSCVSKCEENYKRLTVVVTAKVPGSNKQPAAVRVSTIVTEAS